MRVVDVRNGAWGGFPGDGDESSSQRAKPQRSQCWSRVCFLAFSVWAVDLRDQREMCNSAGPAFPGRRLIPGDASSMAHGVFPGKPFRLYDDDSPFSFRSQKAPPSDHPAPFAPSPPSPQQYS